MAIGTTDGELGKFFPLNFTSVQVGSARFSLLRPG